MEARVLTIQNRQRRSASLVAYLRDFTFVEAETIDANIVLQSNLSLYCLDNDNRRAIFVELPTDIDLSQAPFIYQTQFDNAQRLIAVPYDNFKVLAQRLPEPQQLIFLYSTGRCGSTLLNQVFNSLEYVSSLSEADVLSQFIHLRNADSKSDTELIELLRCCIRFVHRPTTFKTAFVHVAKLRNQSIEIVDLFERAYPNAKKLFLYRNALDWVRSIYRLASRNRVPPDRSLAEALEWQYLYSNRSFEYLRSLFDEDTEMISATQSITLWWLTVMERYEHFYQAGFPLTAWRYEDLLANRQGVLESIFNYCDLPESDVTKVLGSFEKDSQQGTRFAREDASEGNTISLSTAQIAQIESILAKNLVIQTSDFLASGTVKFA
jgi:Sulfotransferase domain